MSVTINGTTGVSLVQNGVLTDANMPSGSVIQVVSFSNNTQNSTSSTSWVSTTVTASITPSNSSNKIVVMVLGGTLDNNGGTNSQCYLTLFRGATNLGNASYGLVELYGSGSTRIQAPASLGYLDSPATTSSTTYTVSLRTNGVATCYYNTDGTYSTMVLMEIAA